MFFAIHDEFILYFVGFLTFFWFFQSMLLTHFGCLFIVEEFVFSLPLSTLIRKLTKGGLAEGFMSSELHLFSGALKQLWFSSSSLFFVLHMQFGSWPQQSFRPFFMQLRSNR